MPSLSRRNILKLAGGSLLLESGAAAERFSKPLGVQLYTLRRFLASEPRAALKAVAEIGYTEVETLRDGSPDLAPLLKEFCLKPVSGYFATPLITDKWTEWNRAYPQGQPKNYDIEKAIEIAGRMGLQYMVIPYLTPRERRGRNSFLDFAERMNMAGEKVRAAGMRLCYHNHGFEFSGWSGTTPFDVLMENFDPELVFWELDVFWCALAGYDPAGILQKHPGRIPLLHLGDKKKGVKKQTEERVVRSDVFTEIGSGDLDFPAILRAAESAGVQHYFVEQDYCTGNPLESLHTSYEYLRGLRL